MVELIRKIIRWIIVILIIILIIHLLIKVSNKSKTKNLNINKPVSTGIKTIKKKNNTDYESGDSTSDTKESTTKEPETVSTPDTATGSNLYILGLIIFGGTTYYILKNKKVEE